MHTSKDISSRQHLAKIILPMVYVLDFKQVK